MRSSWCPAFVLVVVVSMSCVRPPPPEALPPKTPADEAKTRLGDIKRCYEGELKKNPALSGTLVMHWTIEASGATRNVSVERDTLNNSVVAACIGALIARWHFPPPEGGSADVSFPFVFQSNP
jgi:hypothetical protein